MNGRGRLRGIGGLGFGIACLLASAFLGPTATAAPVDGGVSPNVTYDRTVADVYLVPRNGVCQFNVFNAYLTIDLSDTGEHYLRFHVRWVIDASGAADLGRVSLAVKRNTGAWSSVYHDWGWYPWGADLELGSSAKKGDLFSYRVHLMGWDWGNVKCDKWIEVTNTRIV